MISTRRQIASGLGGLGVVVVTVFGPVTAVAASNPTVPYSDPNAQGYIGLCNPAGQPVSQADVNGKPFAWRGLSSVPAPPSFRGQGAKATLFAYQPREGIDPSEWSGLQLTASSTYSNPAHPIAQATVRDYSLAVFLDKFPARWNGFVQLRMYYSARNTGTAPTPYAATDIQVTGSTWSVVRGGNVDCNSGTAFSPESLLPTTNRAGLGSGSAAPAGATRSVGPAARASGSPGAPLALGDVSTSQRAADSGVNTPLLISVGTAAALATAGGYVFWRFRRRRV